MKFPAWLSTKARKAARAEHEDARVARDALFDSMMGNVPDGMSPAPEVRKSVRDSLEQIDAGTARKVMALIESRRAEHVIIVLMIWDVLERRDPNAALNRIADNFDYIIQIGWGYTGSMPGFALRAFAGHLLEEEITTEQQHALLRFEDSRWDKNFTTKGGNKSLIRPKDIDGITTVVVARPHEIERIIDLSTTRKPESVEHYLALLDSPAPEPLKDGEL
jgi:hypothetical protein